MPESLPASRDIDRIRRELEKVSSKLEEVGVQVKEVDRKVERSNATQRGALAAALAADEEVKREVLLYAAGMDVADIAKVVHKSENAVRITLHRAGRTRRVGKAKEGGDG